MVKDGSSVTFTETCPDCGYETTSRTARLAEYALRRHSCERQRRLQAKATRVTERRAWEGEKRDCQCKHAKHEHGTRTAYVVDRCKCRPCLDANSAEARKTNREKAYGRYDTGRVDAEPVREHVRNLMAAGMAWKQVAKVAGISPSTVSNLLYGRYERGHAPYPRILRKNAEKLLAVRATLDNMPSGHVTDATGTHRRLQALVSIGWSQSKLAGLLGIERSNFTAFMNADGCTVKYALAVRDLYDQLWNTPEAGNDHRSRIAASRAMNYAAARRWLPPLAWDDDTIDDPETKPVASVETRLVGAERVTDIEFLIETGCGLDEVIRRSGFKTIQSLEKFCHRWGRGDVATRLRAINTTTRRAA